MNFGKKFSIVSRKTDVEVIVSISQIMQEKQKNEKRKKVLCLKLKDFALSKKKSKVRNIFKTYKMRHRTLKNNNYSRNTKNGKYSKI